MKTLLEDHDIDQIAQRVAGIIKPLLKPQDEPETIFSVDELAEYLRVSNKWVYDHTHELPHFKLGTLLRFKKSDIDRTIDRLSLKVSLNKNT